MSLTISVPAPKARRGAVALWNRDTWMGAVRILSPLGALWMESWPALIGAVLVQEGGLWLAARFGRVEHRRLVRQLFVAGYGLRIAIALPAHFIAKLDNGNGALFRDDYTNDLVGEWLVRIARGEFGTAIFPGHQYLLGSVYSYLLMGIYTLFGYSPLLPKLLNVGLAALCAVLVFDIARKIFSTRAATLAGIAAAVLPSLIVWSIATLKETLVLFAVLAALWAVQFLSTADRHHHRLGDALVLLAAGWALLLDLRSSTTFIIVGLLALVVIVRLRPNLRPWQLGLASASVAALLVGSLIVIRMRISDRPLLGTFEDVALQIRHRRAQEAAGAASQLRSETDVLGATGSTLPAAEAASDAQPFAFDRDVLDPLGYALFAPTPWQAQSGPELAASAEMPVWYVLLFASFFAWRAKPRQQLFMLCLVAYGVATWLILAAVEGNLGNLLRHRLMLDPVLLILGAAGLVWLWERLPIQKAQLPDHQRRYANNEARPDNH